MQAVAPDSWVGQRPSPAGYLTVTGAPRRGDRRRKACIYQIVVDFGPLSKPRSAPLHFTLTFFSAPGGALCKGFARRSNQESGAL